MSEFTQDNRAGILTTPLGKDVLLLVSFHAEEGLSELFEFRIEAVSKKADIDFDQVIGKQCSVKIKTYKKEVREFHGMLVEAQWLGLKNHLFSYRLILRPWLWLLSHKTDCRIFQHMNAPDIIKSVFKDRGFTDFQFRTMGSFPELEYCVQYRETDFNFVSRLMEKEGIYYFFSHEKEQHTLVLTNTKSSYQPVPNHDTIPFNSHDNYVAQEQHIQHWVSGRRFRTGKIELMDYNYEKSKTDMRSQAKGTEHYEHSTMEIYDYPGNYKEKKDGERYAKIELEAEQAHDHRRHGSGDAISLFPGGKTTLKAHPVGSQNTEYVVVRAVHTFGDQSYLSGAREGSSVSYNGHYEFLPSNCQFRAPIVTPKPRIHGIQTAQVVGAAGEEIDVDEYGRIVVQFHWDRLGKFDQFSSCRIRVAEVWSGKKWGGQFIPRVGQEAVVEFLEGDPDRPLVVGTVYNDQYKHPYELPAQKTVSGIKSDKTKGSKGYNEWSFDDMKGCEKITVHAEKDLNLVILNSETREIGQNFLPPKGSPSRTTMLKNGDDNLTIQMGDQAVSIPMGSQSTTAMLTISMTVGMTTVTLTPVMKSVESQFINQTAGLAVNITAGGMINLTAPFINLNGFVLINSMVPMTVPS